MNYYFELKSFFLAFAVLNYSRCKLLTCEVFHTHTHTHKHIYIYIYGLMHAKSSQTNYLKNYYGFTKVSYTFRPIRPLSGEAVTKIYEGIHITYVTFSL